MVLSGFGGLVVSSGVSFVLSFESFISGQFSFNLVFDLNCDGIFDLDCEYLLGVCVYFKGQFDMLQGFLNIYSDMCFLLFVIVQVFYFKVLMLIVQGINDVNMFELYLMIL